MGTFGNGPSDWNSQILAASTSHYHEVVEPMLELEIDYTTIPVSRSIRRRSSADLPALIRLQDARVAAAKPTERRIPSKGALL